MAGYLVINGVPRTVFAYEELVISTAVVRPNAANMAGCLVAYGRFQPVAGAAIGGPVRFRMDGGLPTSALGTFILDLESKEFTLQELLELRLIRDASATADEVLSLHYYR